MGYAATLWFETGERMTRERLGSLARGLSETMLARLRLLGRGKPQKALLEAEIDRALEAASPDASDPD